MNIDIEALIQIALNAREKAYAPYSSFCVGAALLCENGTLYSGCNIESAAYTPTCCAERTAFFKAVSDGERHFRAIAIVGAPSGAAPEQFGFAYPCGVCRQVMAEFCDLDAFEIISARALNDYTVYALGELLPNAFTPSSLK